MPAGNIAVKILSSSIQVPVTHKSSSKDEFANSCTLYSNHSINEKNNQARYDNLGFTLLPKVSVGDDLLTLIDFNLEFSANIY